MEQSALLRENGPGWSVLAAGGEELHLYYWTRVNLSSVITKPSYCPFRPCPDPKSLRKSSRIIHPCQLMFTAHSLYAGHFTDEATHCEPCSRGRWGLMAQDRGLGKFGSVRVVCFPGSWELLGQWLSQKLIFHRVLLAFCYFIPLIMPCVYEVFICLPICPWTRYKKRYHGAHVTKKQNWNSC